MFSEKFHKHRNFIYAKPVSSAVSAIFFITDRRNIPWLLRTIIFTVCISACSSQVALGSSGWPTRVVQDANELGNCDGLLFQNSTLNKCGYCTGGSTGLAQNYGKDCRGICGGLAVEDCDGICGGQAYIDECSGHCIGGTTKKTEKDIDTPSRDCSGLCSGGQYYNDSCGVCRNSGSPAELDCTNKCYLPGQLHLKAEPMCGRCVGGSSDIRKSDVLDACGKCKSEGNECPCNGTGTPDPCGDCQGGGKSCFKIVNFYPETIPADIETKIVVKGAFRGRTSKLKCLITLLLPDNDLGSKTEMKANGNGTHVTCRLRKLAAGMYRVGVSFEGGETAETAYAEDTDLLVYEDLNYSDMSPSKVLFDRGSASTTKSLTVTFFGGQIPSRPLICIITAEGWPPEHRLAKSEANGLDSCVIPVANASIRLNVAPSLNGINPFKKSFTLIFYASPPEMMKYYIAEDGHAVVVVFDRPVNLCKLHDCNPILDAETIEKLGANATCTWATKQQLVISVMKPISGNRVNITFKAGVLKQDNQRYALPKNESLTIGAWYPQPSSNAQIAISGPSTIPHCGSFTLVGHFSSPKGEAKFFWTANRADQNPLGEELANNLLASRTASMTLDSDLLEIDVNYTFILTAEHPVNEKYEARHDVMRKPYVAPLVTAFSDVMDKSSVPSSQEIILQADVTLPDCADGSEQVLLLWTVNNPRIKFDFSIRNSYVYKIAPYSLPENSVVTFTANSFLGTFKNVTTSKITIRVEAFILKAVIKGSSKRIIGNQYGELVLESGNMNDRIPLVYQWRCFDQNRHLCYNYARNATEALLITREQQKQADLKIPCYKLKAGQELTFELQIFNRNNRYQASAIASTTVIVQSGNIPQVVIQSVKVDGVQSIERNPITGAYSVPAQLPALIHATIKLASSKINSVQWDVKGFATPYTYSMKKENTYLSLEEGSLIYHGIYLIGLSACDNKQMCGVANLTIHAVPGVTLCHLKVHPYVEYEMMEAYVSGCSIPIGRQPLTYQLFLHKKDSAFPFTPPQTSTTFNLVGPPSQRNNSTQMSVQVCDKFGHCTLFYGKTVKAFPSADRIGDRSKLLDKAQISLKANNALPALSNYFTALMDPAIEPNDDEIEAILSAAEKASKNRYLTSGQLGLIYSSMQPLLDGSNKQAKLKTLDVMKRATRLAFAHQVKPPLSVLKLGHHNINSVMESPNSDEEVLRKVRLTLSAIQEKIAQSLPLGRRILIEGKNRGQPTTLLFRQLLDRSPITIRGESEQGTAVEGSVSFEEDVRSKVRSWRCTRMKNCDGAVVALNLYPGSAPYDSKDRFVSPVFDVALRKPDTGVKMNIKDMENAIRMSLTHVANITASKEKGMALRCFYWDDENKEWSREGVLTMGIEGKNMNCWSSHLTAFAVLEVYDGLSTASIVGIVVATLMGVFMFGMITFFYVRKKQENLSKVSTEALQPKHVGGKAHGMDRSVARVKRMTP